MTGELVGLEAKTVELTAKVVVLNDTVLQLKMEKQELEYTLEETISKHKSKNKESLEKLQLKL
jgi:hypothetical protein